MGKWSPYEIGGSDFGKREVNIMAFGKCREDMKRETLCEYEIAFA